MIDKPFSIPSVANVSRETIVAIATASGRGGIGVVRVSGKALMPLVQAITGKSISPRTATLATFRDVERGVIDQGIALYFAAPHSYTGEDVLELQGHGGQAVMQRLLQRCVELGCHLAKPGEFTERAFLNNKLDLAQAESVADLIEANSAEAAQSAARSLTGEFSNKVHQLTGLITELRMHVEACIDFPEEEIDPADRLAQQAKLQYLRGLQADLRREAKQGAVLRDGLTVVLIGRPNVGKSSLLNKLAGDEIAIVTPVAGTTRDHIRATIVIDGVPIHLIDTAGLRETEDEVEKIGIARTWQAITKAGAALLIAEAGEMTTHVSGQVVGRDEAEILSKLPATLPVAWVYNKIDIYCQSVDQSTSCLTSLMTEAGTDGKMMGGSEDRHAAINVSALTGEGIPLVREWLLKTAGWQPNGGGVFMARERHLIALRAASMHLDQASQSDLPLELFAEELRLAQSALSSITGEFTPDDLLGEIFGKFCIGK